MKTALGTLLFILALAAGAAADTIVVDNTVDPGDGICSSPGCTLREAINAANINPGADTITFNIAPPGVQTITPTSPLPIITETVTIDGYTQPGASANTLTVGDDAVLLIQLNGSSAGPGATGLLLNSDNSVVRGLVINRFAGSGIIMSSGTGNVIEGNFIGTDATGTDDLGNGGSAGVFLNPDNGDLIGGPLPATRNLISGNDGAGILFANGAGGNTVQGNYVGTDHSGLVALPNDIDGVAILNDCPDNLVGGTTVGDGNLISGNGINGVNISNLSGGVSPHNTVQGNLIGTDANGTNAVPNASHGVSIDGQNDNVVGGTAPGAGNVISGNGANGMLIGDGATDNLVEGNFVGTDVTGLVALGNADNGVDVDGASSNTIGGLVPEARNIISSNSGNGIRLGSGATDNLVEGNFIGTDVTGTADLGNVTGVNLNGGSDNLIGGSVPGAGNVISGNSFGLINANGTGNLVQGNFIGTDATGTGNLGNSSYGVYILSGSDMLIGGPNGFGNKIAFNGNSGVRVNSTSTGNSIFGNSIFANATLGIDLFGGTEDSNGVTANDFPDGDVGANNLQNYPLIDEIAVNGENRSVEGNLASNPNTDYVLNFYSNAEVDPSGYGEGETWLGSLDVHTNAQSLVDFSFPLEPGNLGRFITATATDPDGNTSEFSLASEIVPPLSRFLNISTRLRVQTGDNVLIGGLIVTGNDPKQVIVRAIGPSLGTFGVADPLADPILELHYPDGTTVVTNNNWRDTQEAEIIATGLAPSDDLESAMVATLEPGPYTVIVRGVNGGTGIGLVETYDLDQTVDSALANISTRGLVETGDNVMIGGIIVGPEEAADGSILLRGIGPSLSDFGIVNPLADPTLELRDGNGTLIESNDNWKSTQQAAIETTGLQPSDDLESAILANLAVGSYTAILSGVGGATGIGLVEAYHLD